MYEWKDGKINYTKAGTVQTEPAKVENKKTSKKK